MREKQRFLATQEAEIKRVGIQNQCGNIVHESFLKNP
jgi:hypothetical protein